MVVLLTLGLACALDIKIKINLFVSAANPTNGGSSQIGISLCVRHKIFVSAANPTNGGSSHTEKSLCVRHKYSHTGPVLSLCATPCQSGWWLEQQAM